VCVFVCVCQLFEKTLKEPRPPPQDESTLARHKYMRKLWLKLDVWRRARVLWAAFILSPEAKLVAQHDAKFTSSTKKRDSWHSATMPELAKTEPRGESEAEARDSKFDSEPYSDTIPEGKEDDLLSSISQENAFTISFPANNNLQSSPLGTSASRVVGDEKLEKREGKAGAVEYSNPFSTFTVYIYSGDILRVFKVRVAFGCDILILLCPGGGDWGSGVGQAGAPAAGLQNNLIIEVVCYGLRINHSLKYQCI
jgi:hypothetical protein